LSTPLVTCFELFTGSVSAFCCGTPSQILQTVEVQHIIF
jgi:hypothetical protein